MVKVAGKNIDDYIESLNMNGLQGRMLHLPAPSTKKREILFVYGHHSSLERWWGLIQELNRYGAVTVPDLPGFGGMESLYKIGSTPTLDSLADYLAAFVKLRYKKRRVTIIGLSFGFLVVTRMLQRYPDLTKKVDLLVSVVGFAHKDDLTFSRSRYFFYKWIAIFFSLRGPSWFFRHVCLQSFVLRRVYSHLHSVKDKFKDVKAGSFDETMNFEIKLWHENEVRTHMRTSVALLTVDNCQVPVALPIWHVSVQKDRYFNNELVEQHLKVIFTDFHHIKAKADTHAPSVIADMRTASVLIPPKLRRVLARQ